jgi:hypothetical protein
MRLKAHRPMSKVKYLPMSKAEEVMRVLDRHGILLETDPKLPSVAALVAGSPISGSWWGHPRGHEIFRVSEQLADSPDVVAAKLLSGKVTWVAKRLWPALISIGTAREAWQTQGLSTAAVRLLDILEAEGEARTDTAEWSLGRKSSGDAVRELEKRILIHSESVHTDTGSHTKLIRTWDRWTQNTGFKERKIAPQQAREQFEDIVDRLNVEFKANARLPWR